jgi:rod shape-determining protein MreD
MRNTAFFLTGFALLVVETQMFRIVRILLDVLSWLLRVVHLASAPVEVPGLVPSLLLPLILFMGVHEYSVVRGATLSWLLGYALDLFAGAPVGLHAFTFVAVFVLARSAGVRLAAQTKLMQAVLALGFALVHSVMVLVLLAIFGNDAWVPRAVYPLTLPHVLSTAAIAPLVFMLAQKVHVATATAKRAEAGGDPP